MIHKLIVYCMVVLVHLLCQFLYRKDEAILYEQVLPISSDDELSSLKLPGTCIKFIYHGMDFIYYDCGSELRNLLLAEVTLLVLTLFHLMWL